MSLILSIPFNNSIRNIGLQKNTITSIPSVTPSYIAGPVNNALSFNGSTYWKSQGITLGTEATICFWSKTSTNGKMPWVLESDASNLLCLYESSYYTLNTGDSNSNLFKTDSNASISVLRDNVWHHFAVTFGDGVAKLYIDGLYKGKAITFRNPTTTNKPIKIGGGYQNAHSYDWNGGIADFRVYDHCLTEYDINWIYNGDTKMLQVCLPLNKDCRNVGLNNVDAVSSNVTFVDDELFVKSCNFNGSNSQINTGYLNGLNCNDKSVSVWIKPNGTNVSKMAFRTNGTSPGRFYLGVRNTSWNLSFGSKLWGYTSNATFSNGQWQHIAVILKNNIGNVYFNGEYSYSITGSSFNFPSNLILSPSSYMFNGLMSDLRIYNLALTDEDVKRIYQNEEIILLPTEYEKLEYIQSTGTQYIDTGINPKIKPRAVVKMAIINATDRDYWGNSAVNGSCYYADFKSYNLQYYRYGTTTSQNVNFIVGQNEIHVWDVSDKVYVDGSLKFTSTNTYTYNSSQKTIQIFKAARASYYSSYKLYNFKLYDGDELCRNFVPSKRKSDNVIGLYDMVSRQFFTNSGTGSFTGA